MKCLVIKKSLRKSHIFYVKFYNKNSKNKKEKNLVANRYKNSCLLLNTLEVVVSQNV